MHIKIRRKIYNLCTSSSINQHNYKNAHSSLKPPSILGRIAEESGLTLKIEKKKLKGSGRVKNSESF